jgi:hypothetical protein
VPATLNHHAGATDDQVIRQQRRPRPGPQRAARRQRHRRRRDQIQHRQRAGGGETEGAVAADGAQLRHGIGWVVQRHRPAGIQRQAQRGQPSALVLRQPTAEAQRNLRRAQRCGEPQRAGGGESQPVAGLAV